MKTAYKEISFRAASLDLLGRCNQIIEQYQAQGFRLTLRQLYYQLVSANIITNTERSYKNLGKLVSQGRIGGVLDWAAIEDRLRSPRKVSEWSSPESLMNAAIQGYKLPRWESQPQYVELWCEKDALAGVLTPITTDLHVTLMVNRGYSSQSAMKEAAERLENADVNEKVIKIIYIGDQDPSGEDMVRDVRDRLDLLTRGCEIEVVKIAITEAQITQYNPPPNPAKMTDSRAAKYVEKFGVSSYEADALPPNVLAAVVREAIEAEIDDPLWEESVDRENEDKDLLREARDEVMRRREDRID